MYVALKGNLKNEYMLTLLAAINSVAVERGTMKPGRLQGQP